MNAFVSTLLCFSFAALSAQTNTAVTSGNIGKCSVWAYPGTLYNTAAGTQSVNTGVTVTVNENRNIGAVNLNGTGTMNFSGSNGITLTGTGTEINCSWDISSKGSYLVINNNGDPAAESPLDLGVIFTAPYTGNYRWMRDSVWDASVTGSYLNAGIFLVRNSDGARAPIFGQDQPGSCGIASGGSGTTAPVWNNIGAIALSTGQTLSYRAGSAYSANPSCSDTRLSFNIGTAVVLFEN